MGRIKDDFIEWVESEHPMTARYMNVNEVGTLFEDFLTQKAEEIKMGNKSLRILPSTPKPNTLDARHRNTPTHRIAFTEEELRTIEEILSRM